MAINKYGKENFTLDVIEWSENYNQREKDLIIEYNTLSPNGYNIAKGGEEPPHSYGLDHHNGIVSKDDLKIITKDYEIKEVYPIRMFPLTNSFETLVILKLNSL